MVVTKIHEMNWKVYDDQTIDNYYNIWQVCWQRRSLLELL